MPSHASLVSGMLCPTCLGDKAAWTWAPSLLCCPARCGSSHPSSSPHTTHLNGTSMCSESLKTHLDACDVCSCRLDCFSFCFMSV